MASSKSHKLSVSSPAKGASTPPLKQGVLGFNAAKRAASSGFSKRDARPSTKRTLSSTASSDKSNAIEISSDSSDEDDHNAQNSGENRETESQSTVSRTNASRKLGTVGPFGREGEPVSKKRRAVKGVFDSRDGTENIEAAESTPSEEAKVKHLTVDDDKSSLDLKDRSGRWRKHYGIVREKMGNIEPAFIKLFIDVLTSRARVSSALKLGLTTLHASSVHAHGQNMVDHILRVFDLSYEYGPCIGVTRLERWERAETLGLKPPPEVKEILLTKEGSEDARYSECVFYGEV
ncbi:uncharacterized protein FIBRA_03416 [Fibroporia radiculosa]|uniref:DNA polymerase delta subunit 4 n=1 Tax=Fibroporia radiculosa TaxID=599839 RepID=J4I9L4_9APHY|nr:uncharacterized protein FIBRA_03416 [Fibroporia radiculosa]CCM01366.1 predicted protein [Fibroporia radiculosa]